MNTNQLSRRLEELAVASAPTGLTVVLVAEDDGTWRGACGPGDREITVCSGPLLAQALGLVTKYAMVNCAEQIIELARDDADLKSADLAWIAAKLRQEAKI